MRLGRLARFTSLPDVTVENCTTYSLSFFLVALKDDVAESLRHCDSFRSNTNSEIHGLLLKSRYGSYDLLYLVTRYDPYDFWYLHSLVSPSNDFSLILPVL